MGRKRSTPRTSVFEYLDFRLYLKDLVQELKSLIPGFTMRSFAQDVGFGSPSFLKMIIDGKRRLSTQSLNKLCKTLGIKDKELDYFCALVAFNQSDDPNQKKSHYAKLDKLRPRVTFSKLEQNQRKYLSQDHYSCIREMVLLSDFKEDAKWIASHCIPRIKPADVREAITTLLELGLLKRGANGKLAQSEAIIDTGTQTSFAEAYSYHEAMLNKARRYLSYLPQHSRNFTALTIPIPQELEKTIGQKIHALENEILDLINQKGLVYDAVYQLNIQLFPVTQTKKGQKA